MQEVLWPIRGAWLFLRHPQWWIRPLVGMSLALATFIGLGVSTAWWLWPIQAEVGWLFWWWSLFAVGMGFAVVVMAWVLSLPILMSLLLEDLARRVLIYLKQNAGVAPPKISSSTEHQHQPLTPSELPLIPGVLASLKVLGGTLVPRVGWMGASLVSGLIIPPSGVVVSALGMGHIACIDACDIALSLHGLNGERRLAALRAHRNEIRQAALTAGIVNLALAVTVIGWVIWLPGIVVGAVLRTQEWEELC
jgi:hypothetical protein